MLHFFLYSAHYSLSDYEMSAELVKIIKQFNPEERGNLIPVLQSVQEKEGFISAEAVKMISSHLGISRSNIFGVATFYSQFKFNLPGRMWP